MRYRESVLLGLSIVLLGTPLLAQETRMGPVPRTWSGGGERLETEPFPIRDGSWRIDWDTVDAAPGSYLLITVRHESGTAIESFTHQGESSGSHRVDTRPGIYYLEITGVDLEWTVSMSERVSPTSPGPPTLPVQACTGRGTVGGQGFVEAGVGFGDDARAYSLGGGYDSQGPATVRFAGLFGDNDGDSPDTYGAGGNILIEVTGDPLSVCPNFGLTYSRFEEAEELEDLGIDLDLDFWAASAGVAFGVAVPAGDSGIFVMPVAAPALLAVHGRGSVEVAGEVEEESETEIEFGSTAGLFFGGSRLYGGLTVNVTTIEGSDPTFGLGFGVAF